MMMGSTMQTELDEGRGQAVGSHIRMSGRILGVDLFLDEVVLQREPPRYKVWETVGVPRLLVINSYRLGFDIASLPQAVTLRVFIGYNLPSRVRAAPTRPRSRAGLREMVRQTDARWRSR